MANKNPILPPDNTGKTYEKHKQDSVRVHMFKQCFLNPTSATFWNARGSAIRAGYSETYADNITVQQPKWYVELQTTAEYRRAGMLERAEKNIDKRLSKTPETPLQEKLQADTDKYVSERLGKEHYSTRSEVTAKGGRNLFTNETKDDADLALESMFIGVAPETEDT